MRDRHVALACACWHAWRYRRNVPQNACCNSASVHPDGPLEIAGPCLPASSLHDQLCKVFDRQARSYFSNGSLQPGQQRAT